MKYVILFDEYILKIRCFNNVKIKLLLSFLQIN